MTIVDLSRGVTGGVDTHLDLNVAAAVDAVGGLLGVAQFATTSAGRGQLLSWLNGGLIKHGVGHQSAVGGDDLAGPDHQAVARADLLGRDYVEGPALVPASGPWRTTQTAISSRAGRALSPTPLEPGHRRP
jgi:hypothetical protein